MAISGDAFDISSSFTNAFTQVFKKDADTELFNFKGNLLKSIKVTEGFVGTNEERVRATSFMGGYGFNALPRNNESNLIRPRLEAKKYYSTALVDVESIAAAMKSEGAFFELVSRVKMEVSRAMENGLSLALTKTNADSELVLGVVASGGVSGSNPYVLTLDAFHEHNFHIKQIVTIEDGNSDLFEVTSLDPSAGTVTVTRLTGSQVPAAGDEIMLQGADGNAFMGLPGACAASGTLYNVSIGAANNWRAVRDTAGGSITEHRLYNMVLDIANQSSKVPNLIAMGKVQYQKIAEQLANKRVLNDLSDKMGHMGLALEGPEGPIPIIWDRHIEDDVVYVLNKDHIELRKRPLSGMVESGGDVLLQMYTSGQDQYLIVYRCYGNFYIEPTYHGIFDGLST